ncbi:MAG: leucine-rich repeat protein [Ruminococcus sp.]|nr:leucine-rich repeat protein [Ruminococcus sp.]
MKIIKRIASVITATAISVCCMNFTQYDYEKNSSIVSSAAELDFKTSINEDGTIAVYGYTGTDEKVIVPRTIGERTVTAIGKCCFEDNQTIKEVVLPDTIKIIDYKAFADCKNLETVNIPDGIEIIDEYAFTTCHSLKSIDLKNVKKLGNNAFQLCISLEEIYVPGSITTVTEQAFHGCHSVKTLTFGEGVKKIESTAALNSFSIEKITIPKSVTEIGEYALGYYYYHPNYVPFTPTFYVYNNTAGLEYAQNNGFDYVIIDGAETTDFLLGDVNSDGAVNSSDASLVLAEYGLIQTNGTLTFTDTQKKSADVNKDSKIDSADASKILEYYAAVSTGQTPSWD